jgi:acetolactate synthase-1/2/3 large subunit
MPAARELYESGDVVLGIGTEFSETDYDFFFDGNFRLTGKLIRVDIDQTQLSRNVIADIAIQSDATSAIEALLAALPEKSTKEGAARAEAANAVAAKDKHPGYQHVLDCILDTLPDCALLGDSTQPVYFAADQYFPNTPRRFASAATGYGTLGYALPAAFGARLALPDTPVVALIGDGGLQFSINELAAGVEAGLGVAIIVWNNQRYEMIAQNFETAGMPPMACDIYTPDFIAIAKGYGCQALRASNLQELQAALQGSQMAEVPVLIELVESDFIDD